MLRQMNQERKPNKYLSYTILEKIEEWTIHITYYGSSSVYRALSLVKTMGQAWAIASGQLVMAKSLDTNMATHCIHGSTDEKVEVSAWGSSLLSILALQTEADLSSNHCRSTADELRIYVCKYGMFFCYFRDYF